MKRGRRLTIEELNEFYQAYVEWWNAVLSDGPGASPPFSHPRIEDVARYHILPLLSRARMKNLERSIGGLAAARAAEGFAHALACFLEGEVINLDNRYRTSQDIPGGTQEQIIVNTIALRIITAPDPSRQRLLQFRSILTFCMYLAQLSVDTVEKEIEPFWMPHRKPPIESLEELTENGREIGPAVSLWQNRGGPDRETVRRAARALDPVLRVLFVLHKVAGYTFRQISLALQYEAPPIDSWQQAEPHREAPALPREVWPYIRRIYGLPGWATVRRWFRGSLQESALRKYYERARKQYGLDA